MLGKNNREVRKVRKDLKVFFAFFVGFAVQES